MSFQNKDALSAVCLVVIFLSIFFSTSGNAVSPGLATLPNCEFTAKFEVPFSYAEAQGFAYVESNFKKGHSEYMRAECYPVSDRALLAQNLDGVLENIIQAFQITGVEKRETNSSYGLEIYFIGIIDKGMFTVKVQGRIILGGDSLFYVYTTVGEDNHPSELVARFIVNIDLVK